MKYCSVLLFAVLAVACGGTTPVPTVCGPDTCQGCCSGNYCMDGTSTQSCGRVGAQCLACDPNFSCISGSCRANTNPPPKDAGVVHPDAGNGDQCSPETDAELCLSKGLVCGSVSAADNCGKSRSIASCGTCAVNHTCSAGICLCSSETDAAFCARRGAACGSVTGDDNCGITRTVASCGFCSGTDVCGSVGLPNVCVPHIEAMKPVCTPTGVCWENPLPQGFDLTDVWTLPSGSTWAVGRAGTVLHWNLTAWSGWAEIVDQDFYGVWASSDSDVWAVGAGGIIYHYDGVRWKSVASSTTLNLNDIVGSAANDVWAVGDGGMVLHWNGIKWAVRVQTNVSPLYSVNLSGANNVWAVGDSVVLNYDGVSWNSIYVAGQFRSVWATSATDVWISGPNAPTMRWNGAGWRTYSAVYGRSFFGKSPTDLWLVHSMHHAFHFDGIAWTESGMTAGNNDLCVSGISGSANGMVAVGCKGLMLRGSGGTWGLINKGALPQLDGTTYLSKLIANSVGEAYASGSFWDATTAPSQGIILARGIDGIWKKDLLTADPQDINVLGTNGSTEVWAASTADRKFLQRGVSGWSSQVVFNGLVGMVPISSTMGWGITSNRIVQWDGTSWYTWQSFPGYLFSDISAASSSSIWVAGDSGLTVYWDGYSWTPGMINHSQDINAISFAASGTGMATGSFGITEWNGADWVDTAAYLPAKAVWVQNTLSAWAVTNQLLSADMTIAHWNGIFWLHPVDPRMNSLIHWVSISGNRQNVWLLGEGGEVLSQ